MTQLATPKKLLLALGSALGSALLATACTVTLDPDGSGDDGGPDECLQLFETCVELAGDSPGCDAVFEYCTGSAEGGDDGDPPPEPGCEDDYINCLADGHSPDECQPILEDCYGGEDDGGDEGSCMDPDDPECNPCADGSCEPNPDCEQLAELCVEVQGGLEEWCYGEILNACYEGDCAGTQALCDGVFGPEECEAVTGCSVTPQPPFPDECEDLLNECYDAGFGDEECAQLYPECFDLDPPMPPEPAQCEWYWSDCFGQFAEAFCQAGGEACEVGILPETFECHEWFPIACVDVSDEVCAQAEDACLNGFFDVEFCGSLTEDAPGFVHQLAQCNGWE